MENSLIIQSSAVTDRGLSEKRPQNEDSYLEMPQSGIFAVADGVGGAQAGEVASQMAMEILAEAFANLPSPTDAEAVMRTAIERANTAIHQMAHELPQLSSMATTIVALHLAGNIATIGHVGDSRLYRVDRDGNLHRDTDDHSMVAEEVRAGRMTEEQADTHPSRNIISRALGAELLVEPDLKTIMVEPGTSFLLCSDGVTRHVADDEIKGVLNFGGAPADVCEYLKGLCYERGAEDNLTAVVVKAASDRTASVGIDDEPTVATARVELGSETEDLLELETRDLIIAEADDSSDTVAFSVEDAIREAAAPQAEEPFSIFGETATSGESAAKPGRSSLLAYLAVLALGGLLGFGAYHFALVRNATPPDTGVNQLTEMRTANIPLSAFEENRRNVDKDPAGYLAKFGADPQDSEDYYLVGRAMMLTGDFPKARTAFTEARNRLKEADPVNAAVLADDIAIAIAVTNDTTIQTNLKKEFDAVRPQAITNTTNTNTTTNANR